MNYGLDNYVNNNVSDPVLLLLSLLLLLLFFFFFLTVLQLDIKKKENVVPKSFYFCTR